MAAAAAAGRNTTTRNTAGAAVSTMVRVYRSRDGSRQARKFTGCCQGGCQQSARSEELLYHITSLWGAALVD